MSSARRPDWSACTSCWKPPTRTSPIDDLREAQHPGLLDQLRASGRVLCEIDLVELELADLQQLLGALAERARICRVDSDLGHYFTKYSGGVVAGPGEGPGRGAALAALRRGRPHPAPVYPAAREGRRDRQGRAPHAQPLRRPPRAVLPPEPRPARGARRPAHRHRRPRRSTGYPRAARGRRGARHRRARVRRGRAPVRDLRAASRASTTCSATSSRCSTPQPAPAPGHANQLAFRLKLLLAAGLAPQLAACASCGEREHLSGFSGAAGGVVCPACEAGSFPLGQDAHDFLVDAIGLPAGRDPGRRRAGAAPGRARDRRDARASRRNPLAPRRAAR